MIYPKEKAIENLRNTTEFLQFTLFGLCLATSDEAVPINSVEKVHLTLGSCIIDLTNFGQEFIKDRKHQGRIDSTLVKLLSSGVSMAYNVAEKYYKNIDTEKWRKKKRWVAPYPYASQIRNMFSHGFFWKFHSNWIDDYENNVGSFPIAYRNLTIEKDWHERKSRIEDISPCGDLVQLVEDIIADISSS